MNRHHFFPLYLIVLSVFLYILSPVVSAAEGTDEPLFSSSLSGEEESSPSPIGTEEGETETSLDRDTDDSLKAPCPDAPLKAPVSDANIFLPDLSISSDADFSQKSPESSLHISESETINSTLDGAAVLPVESGSLDTPALNLFPEGNAESSMDSMEAQERDTLLKSTAAQERGTSQKATPSKALKAAPAMSGEPKRVASVQGLCDYVLFLRAGESLSSLPLDSHELSNAYVTLEGDRFGTLFPVHYDASQFDTASSGLHLLHGTVTLPPDYEASPELADVKVPVAVWDPGTPFEMPITGSFEPIAPLSPFAAPVGVSRQELEDSLHNVRSTIEFEISGGYKWSADIVWDCSSVDTGTAGAYKVYSRLSLLDGILVSAPPALPYAYVDIQDPDKLTLTTPTFNNNRGVIEINWLKYTPDKEKFHLWYKKDEGIWTEDTEGDIMSLVEAYGKAFNSLFLTTYILEVNIPYYFYIEYEGEESNVLQITRTSDGFNYTQLEGDRDGGDSDEQKPPEIFQPPPNNVSPETPPLDTVTPDTSQPETGPSLEVPAHGGQSLGGTQSSSGRVYQSSDKAGLDKDASTGPGMLNSVPPYQTGPQAPVFKNAPSQLASPSQAGSEPSDSPVHIGANPPDLESPTGSKPPISSKSTAKPAAAPAIPPAPEEDTANYTIWSGIRILKSMEMNPEQPLIFEKHGIRLELPATSGPLARVTAKSSLRVEILPLEKYQFYISISMDKTPLSSLPGMAISLPLDGEQNGLSAKNADVWEAVSEDGTITKAVYDPVKRRLRFPAQTTGTFTIRPVETALSHNNNEEETLSSRLVPTELAVGCGLSAILAAALWNRGRHRRK